MTPGPAPGRIISAMATAHSSTRARVAVAFLAAIASTPLMQWSPVGWSDVSAGCTVADATTCAASTAPSGADRACATPCGTSGAAAWTGSTSSSAASPSTYVSRGTELVTDPNCNPDDRAWRLKAPARGIEAKTVSNRAPTTGPFLAVVPADAVKAPRPLWWQRAQKAGEKTPNPPPALQLSRAPPSLWNAL